MSTYDTAQRVLYPESADGTLVIIVCRAKHLPNRRKLDKQSPYVTLRMGTLAKKTPSQFRGGQTPEWLHEIRFDISKGKKPIVRVDVLDETKNEPTAIGNCEIDCSVVFRDPLNNHDGRYIYDRWHDLKLNGVRAGMIYLEMTFYPTAPVLPPKVINGFSNEESVESYHDGHLEIPPPPPKHPSQAHAPTVADEVFVSKENEKKLRLSFLSNALSPPKEESSNWEVVVKPHDESKGKYKSKFSKFKLKFLSREPITNLWDKNSDNDSDIDTFTKSSHFEHDDEEYHSLGESLEDEDLAPPPPPPHHAEEILRGSSLSAKNILPQRPNENSQPKRHVGRKPPKDLNHGTYNCQNDLANTSIPFSAETLGFEDDAEMLETSPIPTKVYFMDKPIKSLTHSAHIPTLDRKNPDEIDPKYFAPTPSAELVKSLKLSNGNLRYKEVMTDLRTKETGYLGNGKWKNDNKFSPSVFDRIGHDCENIGFENKPQVPPKVPLGLTEREYYTIDKDSYLKDINGRRT